VAQELGLSGTTRVRLFIDAQGEVTRVEVLQSAGSEMLDRAALAYYRRHRFRPAMRDGVPVAAVKDAALTWRLPRNRGGNLW
jgi:protein TonB